MHWLILPLLIFQISFAGNIKVVRLSDTCCTASKPLVSESGIVWQQASNSNVMEVTFYDDGKTSTLSNLSSSQLLRAMYPLGNIHYDISKEGIAWIGISNKTIAIKNSSSNTINNINPLGIFFYNGEQTKELAIDYGDLGSASVKTYDGTVVWYSTAKRSERKPNYKGCLKYYDGKEIIKIGDVEKTIENLSISKDLAAWLSKTGSRGNYLYTINMWKKDTTWQKGPFTTKPKFQISPSHIAWILGKKIDKQPYKYSLYYSDHKNIVEVTQDAGFEFSLSGKYLAWIASQTVDSIKMNSILLFDGNAVKTVFTSPGQLNYIHNCGEYIVWCMNYDVFFFNGQTVQRITKSKMNDWRPKVSKELIAWYSRDINNKEYILKYDIQKE